jgi:hypothetical protein
MVSFSEFEKLSRLLDYKQLEKKVLQLFSLFFLVVFVTGLEDS